MLFKKWFWAKCIDDHIDNEKNVNIYKKTTHQNVWNLKQNIIYVMYVIIKHYKYSNDAFAIILSFIKNAHFKNN